MGLFNDTIIMIQYFPDIGDYIVHREGSASVETYNGDDEIQDVRIHRFLRECLAGKFYHENTVYLSTNKASGSRSTPVRQIVYCKLFANEDTHSKNQNSSSNINWILWAPSVNELTVNRGVLGVSKVVRLPGLKDAPQEVLTFIKSCIINDHIALGQHYVEPDRSTGELEMKHVSEYFFSIAKVIYGFQHERVFPITPDEMDSLGLSDI